LLLDRFIGATSALAVGLMCLPLVTLHIALEIPPMLIWLTIAMLVMAMASLFIFSAARRLVARIWLLTYRRRLHVLILFAFSMFMHALFAWGIQLAGIGLGLPLTFINTLFAVAGGMLLVVIPVSLAGIGPAEAGAAALFLATGYASPVALMAGTLPYLARVVGGIEGGLWELLQGGLPALSSMLRVVAQKQPRPSN
jgi:uncharacterized membrane protein YbhN (UPF0104 family)